MMLWLVLSLLIVSIALNLVSFTWQLYEVVWWYDKAVHAFTTFAFTLPLPLLLHKRVLRGVGRHRLLVLLVVACLGLALGAIWEIIEWGVSQVWGDPSLNEGRRDVITDLVYDGFGALAGARLGLALLRLRRSSS
jgi:uncharacterized membrane protein YjdF